MKNIFAIVGSASENSSNERLISYLENLTRDYFRFTVYKDLKKLPHFDPELSIGDTPTAIVELRNQIADSDGVLLCTPEYIFSVPSGLKNILEWCVSTTVFTDKPLGIITASADGQHGHNELKMIMRTLMARFTDDATLLINGIKGKVDINGNIRDIQTMHQLKKFLDSLKTLFI